MDHPTIGELPLVGSPLKMSDTPVEYRLPPLLMGEHTEEVLRALGYKVKERVKQQAQNNWVYTLLNIFYLRVANEKSKILYKFSIAVR